jgi:hypothetical protein
MIAYGGLGILLTGVIALFVKYGKKIQKQIHKQKEYQN